MSPIRPKISKKLVRTRRWTITTNETMLVSISRNWDIVGSDILTIPALNDHKNIPKDIVKIIRFSLDFKLYATYSYFIKYTFFKI